MYHKDSEKNKNSLRKLKTNKVNTIDSKIHNFISEKIAWNENDFIVFPVELPKTFLNKITVTDKK